jgi:hypothetical protein
MSREFKGCSIAFALLQPFFNTTGPFFDWLTFIRLGLVEIPQLELVEFTRRTTATNRAEKTVIIGKISPLQKRIL